MARTASPVTNAKLNRNALDILVRVQGWQRSVSDFKAADYPPNVAKLVQDHVTKLEAELVKALPKAVSDLARA